MKNFLTLIFTVLSVFSLKAQSCTLSVIDCGQGKIQAGASGGNPCMGIYSWGGWRGNVALAPTTASYSYKLYKKGPGGVFSYVANSTQYDYGVYTGLAAGTYQVEVYKSTCSSVDAFDSSGRLLGKRGLLVLMVYSNEVTIGSASVVARAADWTGVSTAGNAVEWAFDPDDAIKINTTGTEGYTHYWVGIFELNGAQRVNQFNNWQWKSGKIPNNLIDLREAWRANGTGYEFTPGGSYRLQFAVSNPCMSQWIVTEPGFVIGPNVNGGFRPYSPAQGDALKKSANKEVLMFPNPAQEVVHFMNLSQENDYQCQIFNTSGQLLSQQSVTTRGVVTNDLTNGLYIVKLLSNGEQIYTNKLSIAK